MSLANSPRLPDWRQYVDQTQLTPQARRRAEQAIRDAEQEWAGQHEAWYRDRFRRNRDQRDEDVTGVCDSLIEELDDMISDLRSGRLTSAAAASRWRSVDGQIPRITELHETLVADDAKLAEDAKMTADDFQALRLHEQSDLIPRARLADIINEPANTFGLYGGGALMPRPGYRPQTYDAPSADDLRN